MDSAAERRRAIVSAAMGSGFPALGIHVSDGTVMLGGLAGGSFRRSKPLGQLKGARAEILPGKHIDQGTVWASRLLTGTTPMSRPIVFITFADDTYHEHQLEMRGFTVEGSIRKAKDEARRFNALARQAK